MIEFYAAHKLLVWFLSIFFAVGGCLAHYLRFGPHDAAVSRTSSAAMVGRFGVRELIFHWLCLIGFGILTITGLQQIISGAAHSPIGPFHGWLGFIFFLLSLITLLGWLPDALFRQYDWQWLQRMGGYLSRNPKPLPAGRFNAGQKIYYWSLLAVLIGLLVSAIIMEHGSHSLTGRRELYWCIHGLLGCLAAFMVIGHGYLSLFANPYTSRVLWSGRVSKAYADTYHSLWKVRQ